MAQKSAPKTARKTAKLSAETTKLPPPSDDFWYTQDPHSPRRSEKATPKSIQRIATAYACVDVYGKTMGMLPGSVYKRKKTGGKDLQNKHPLYRVLRKPNAVMDSFQFWQLKERTQILHGNFYAQKIFNGFNELVALHPIHPTNVTVREVSGKYDIEFVINTNKGQRVLSRDEVFHTKEPGEDGLVGRSRIQIAASAFELALAYQSHNQSLTENDSRPLGLLSPEVPIRDKEQRDKLVESWEESHKGPRKAGRVAVVPFGVKYHQLSMTARDAQLLELMIYYGVDSVNTIFDVPPYRTQDFRRATFSNVEQADMFWAKNSVAPRVVATEKAIEAQLLTEKEREDIFVKFNIDAIFRADIKTRYEAHRYAIQDGWLNREEIRVIEDWDPAGEEHGLKEFLVPSNMTTAKAMMEAADKPKEPEKTPAEEPKTEEKDAQVESKNDEEALSALLNEPLKRLVLKEKRAILKCLKKEKWSEDCDKFYQKHQEHLSETLKSTLSGFLSSQNKSIEETKLNHCVVSSVSSYMAHRAEQFAAHLTVSKSYLEMVVDQWDKSEKLETTAKILIQELIRYEQ